MLGCFWVKTPLKINSATQEIHTGATALLSNLFQPIRFTVAILHVLSSCCGTAWQQIRTAVQTFACLTSKPFVKNLNKPADILKNQASLTGCNSWPDVSTFFKCCRIDFCHSSILGALHWMPALVSHPWYSKSLTSADVLTKSVWGGREMAGAAVTGAIINACGPLL